MRFSNLTVLFLMVRTLAAQAVPASTPEFFETKIRPVLANNCFGCHTNTAMGGLRLDSPEALAKGGKRGAAIVAGDPDKSPLIAAIRASVRTCFPASSAAQVTSQCM